MNQLFVADTLNHRVVVLPVQNSGAGAATSVLGQVRFDAGSINLIEGKEFQFLWQGGADAGIAIDSTGSTPHLYVADPGNKAACAAPPASSWMGKETSTWPIR